MKNIGRDLVIAVFAIIALSTWSPTAFAACGDIITTYDYGDGQGAVDERAPITNCTNPFNADSPTPFTYELTLAGQAVGQNSVITVVEAEPVPGTFVINKGGNFAYAPLQLYRKEGDDYRQITLINNQNFITDPLADGEYVAVLIYEEPPFQQAQAEPLWKRLINTLFMPTVAYAFVSVYDPEVVAIPFTVEYTAPAPTGASSVLFLPGIEASRLYRADYNGGTDQLWEPNTENDVTDLFLDENGKSLREDIYTKDVIDEANVLPILQGNIYKSFLSDLAKWKNDDIIADYSAVPYDWRLSLEDIVNNGGELSDGRIYYAGIHGATSTPYIIQELRRLAASSKTGKVTIIAHSNGGLLTKVLTDKLGAEASTLIDQIIFVAVPQVGTPQAIGALLHGYDQGLPYDWLPILLSPAVSREFASNAPMTYNLLPTAKYFDQSDDPVVTFDDSSLLAPWRERYGNSVSSSESLQSFINDQSRIALPVSESSIFPISGNEYLSSKAETIHDTGLDNWSPPPGMKLTEIAGWGVKTLSSIEYSEGRKTYCSTPGDIYTCTDVPALEFGVKETSAGDGTVVVQSALWAAPFQDVKKYYVDLDSYNIPLIRNRKHADILEVSELRDLIEMVITNSESELPQFIHDTTPLNISSSPYLRFILHSPLNPHLFDESGNHTGISSTTGLLEENIPGSRYQTYGELTLIEVPVSTALNLVMEGNDNGSFTLDIDKVSNEVVVASTTFAAIPSFVGTVVTMSIPTGGDIVNASPLSVDEDGDGTADIILEPALGSVVTPVFIPPPEPVETVASIAGTLGTNYWYTSDVEVTFTTSVEAETYYSMNEGIEWSTFSPLSPILISSEGINTLQYYSVDTEGNRDATSTLVVTIDKTAPKASIAIDSANKDLVVEGIDNAGDTTVIKNGDSYIVTDQAGHTTKLNFKKKYVKSRLIKVDLMGVQYDGALSTISATGMLIYSWDKKSPQTLLSQTIVKPGAYVVIARYDKRKDKTTVFSKEVGKRLEWQQFPGLHVVTMTVDKGVVGYEL